MEVERFFALKIPYLAIYRLEPEKTIVMLDFSTFNYVFKYRTEIVLFGYFWTGIPKTYCNVVFYITTLNFFCQRYHHQKFPAKMKILKFGTKIALIGYLGLEFQKTNVAFKINILEFVNLQILI